MAGAQRGSFQRFQKDLDFDHEVHDLLQLVLDEIVLIPKALLDGVEVWVETAYKTSALSALLNPHIPGIGVSFHNLITNEAQFLSGQIDQAQLQSLVTHVADFESRMDSPIWGDILGTFIYVIVTILLAAAQAVAIVVIAYGFIATAVCVLVGPVFIPFFIVPKMEWLFWGWFRCFIQYAFYQVIAAAVVFVIGNLILGILQLPPAGALSTVQLIAWFPVLFITFLASIYALLKVPALTNHIFSGTAGGSSAGIVGSVVGGLLP